VKIRRRAAKARAIEEKAHNAGKVEGETFRKVFTTYLITNVSTKDKKKIQKYIGYKISNQVAFPNK